MKCRYCTIFDAAKERFKISEKKYTRKCIIVGKDKSEGDDACSSFKPVSHVWCDEDEKRVSIQICKRKKCKDCRQYKDIINVLAMD